MVSVGDVGESGREVELEMGTSPLIGRVAAKMLTSTGGASQAKEPTLRTRSVVT